MVEFSVYLSFGFSILRGSFSRPPGPENISDIAMEIKKDLKG